jgi:hypothetical protein
VTFSLSCWSGLDPSNSKKKKILYSFDLSGRIALVTGAAALRIRLFPLRESFYGGGGNLRRGLFDVLQ